MYGEVPPLARPLDEGPLAVVYTVPTALFWVGTATTARVETFHLKVALTLTPAASVTRTVTVVELVVLGDVPEIRPVAAFRLSQLGKPAAE